MDWMTAQKDASPCRPGVGKSGAGAAAGSAGMRRSRPRNPPAGKKGVTPKLDAVLPLISKMKVNHEKCANVRVDKADVLAEFMSWLGCSVARLFALAARPSGVHKKIYVHAAAALNAAAAVDCRCASWYCHCC